MQILGIIPARGGSKGVPNKNIRKLCGKPLIEYTIRAGLQSIEINKLIVSTEDPEIARISEALGAEVPFVRPRKLAEDHAPTIDVVVHAINFFLSIDSKFDAVCLLQPTVPFRELGEIDQAIRKFKSSDSDSLISVNKIPHQFNPHWAFVKNKGRDTLQIATGDASIIPRRQDLPDAYFRNGSIYITRTEVILKENSLYGKRISYFETSPENAVNIDTLDDWSHAEEILKKNEG